MMIGHAAMTKMAQTWLHIDMVGDGYAGESGTHTFLDNGDVGGSVTMSVLSTRTNIRPVLQLRPNVGSW